MTQENWKQALTTIFIGVCVSFFATLFGELATFIRTHGVEILSGSLSASLYGIKNIKV